MTRLHFLVFALLVGNSFCMEEDVAPISHIQFGVDSNKEAWFKFKNENGQLISYERLRHFHDLFSGELDSSTYSLWNDASNWTTLTFIAPDEVSITITTSTDVMTVIPRDGFGLEPKVSKRRELSDARYVISRSKRSLAEHESCIMKSVAKNTRSKRHGTGLNGPLLVKRKKRTSADSTASKTRRWLQRAPAWANCYPAQSITRFLDIGIVVDMGRI